MCGRFTMFVEPKRLAERFGLINPDELDFRPGYNIAPTSFVPAIINEEEKYTGKLMHWSIIPRWSNTPKTKFKTHNARADNVNKSRLYKPLLPRKRCIIPASGFYEWRKSDKQPFYIFPINEDLFSFAGIWDTWESKEGEVIHSCTIITTEPNHHMETLHDRMPVILEDKATEEAWLDPTNDDREYLRSFLKPCSSETISSHAVGKAVGSVRNQGKELVESIS